MPGSSAHTSATGMSCSCLKPVLLWYRSLGSVAVEIAMSELWKSLIAGIPPLFSGGTIKLSLCILSLKLCCSLSCAQPHPSLDLNHWLAFLAKRETCLVTVGWLWWSWIVADPGFSPDLLCFSGLSICACIPGQWGHCPCLCCGHPLLLTRCLLQRWLPLNASSHEFLYSFRNREACFLSLITAWKTSTENTDTHKCWTWKVGMHALLSSPCSSGCQHIHASTGLHRIQKCFG